MRSMHPDHYAWDTNSMVTAQAVDALNLLVWFKTKDGSKGRNRPEPLPRPGVEPSNKSRHVKGDVMPFDELKRRLKLRQKQPVNGA